MAQYIYTSSKRSLTDATYVLDTADVAGCDNGDSQYRPLVVGAKSHVVRGTAAIEMETCFREPYNHTSCTQHGAGRPGVKNGGDSVMTDGF